MDRSERESLVGKRSSHFSTRRKRFRPRAPARLARLVLSVFLAGCADDCSSSGPILSTLSLYPTAPKTPPPTPSAVYVAPAEVFVGGGNAAAFKLRVLVDYSDGSLHEPGDGAVVWAAPAPPTGTTVSGDGMLGDVNITQTFTADFVVNATVGGVTGSSTIKALSAGPTSSDIVVAADHSGELPTIALAGGWLSPTECAGAVEKDDPVAFVRRGPLQSLQKMPATVAAGDCRLDGALFSPITAIWRDPMSWTSTQDDLHAVAPGGAPLADPAIIRPKIRLVIGISNSFCAGFSKCKLGDVIWGAKTLATLGAALANDIFARSRAGIQLDLPVAAPADVADMTGVDECEKIPKSGPLVPNANELTIYMVDELNTTAYAVTCHEYDRPKGVDSDKKVILIGYRYATVISTLAHELGHAFGLRKPQHVSENITGFGAHNLMAEISDAKVDRFHLTLGQVYRMTLDETSWLNKSGTRGGATVACQCEIMDAKPCPRLSRDIKPLEKPVNWNGPKTCL